MQQNKTIGIIGGGQLARMLSIAAKKLGFTVFVSDPTPDSPAGQVADKQIIGGYKDEATTRELAAQADVVTIDAEFVNTAVLKDIARSGKPVYPTPEAIEIIKDKLAQKQFLQKNNLPTAAFIGIETIDDIKNAATKFGYPLLLKARFDAYDGKGNFVLQSSTDIEKGLLVLQGRELYVEKFVPFVKELAIMIAKSTTGEIKSFPVVETLHKDNICDTVLVPARISEDVKKQAEKIVEKIIETLGSPGIFGVEMFLEKDDTIRINEIAPRVHNSGHYTIESCITSQFEQHIRAITGMKLGDTALTVKAAVMKNILGEKNGSGILDDVSEIEALGSTAVHMYGKKESRIKRKMGHITVTGETIEECLAKAQEARGKIVI